MKRWSRTDQIVGVATLVLIISLFLPWVTVSLGAFGSASASGTSEHGYLWIVFIVGLLILGYLVLTAGFDRLPFSLPARHEQLLLAATGLNLVLVLIGFLFKAGTGISSINVSIGWGFGAFLGLIAAIVAFVPVIMPLVQGRSAR